METGNDWIQKRGENAIFYEVSCKDPNYKQIIDDAFIEIAKLIINKGSNSEPKKPNIEETLNQNNYGRIPRETDPAKRRMNQSGRTCGGPSNCINPITQNSTSETFC